jgi:hypothetical protein
MTNLSDILAYTDTLSLEDQARIALHIRDRLNKYMTAKQLTKFGVKYPGIDPDKEDGS